LAYSRFSCPHAGKESPNYPENYKQGLVAAVFMEDISSEEKSQTFYGFKKERSQRSEMMSASTYVKKAKVISVPVFFSL